MFRSRTRCAGIRRWTSTSIVVAISSKYTVMMWIPSLTVPATCTPIRTSFDAPAGMENGYVSSTFGVIPCDMSKLDSLKHGSPTVMLAFPVFFSSSVTIFSTVLTSPYRASSVTSQRPSVTARPACAVCMSITNTVNSNIIFLIQITSFSSKMSSIVWVRMSCIARIDSIPFCGGWLHSCRFCNLAPHSNCLCRARIASHKKHHKLHTPVKPPDVTNPYSHPYTSST